MIRRGVFDRTPKVPIWRSVAKVKEIKVGSKEIITERFIMFDIETITMTTTSIGVTMVIETIKVGLMFRLKIEKLLKGWLR